MVGIKDFEIPKNCEDCRFFMGRNSHCAFGCFIPQDYDYYSETYKNEKCPLIEDCVCGALDIINKYQKIQEIVEHWACCGNPSDSMIAISEVIEDGKTD